ncbi:hypothetical protein [Micromonospora deserti]|uniref:Uncharacterized protein n=1 Tax=Micromonospora deserti TaxID=2070366 RepID=A0A2W2CSD4_9ACTN|nr:hypothetical protein [Micromonospora deserti]PZG01503.1 hypothetical protein C1I99_06735 [Micromonospora deserti]
MIARVVNLELRRGAGLILFVGLAAVGLLMTAMAGLPSDRTGAWSSSGPGIVSWLNTTGLVLGPLAAAGGAWVGGRDRRLGVGELLAAVPKPRWQRDMASFGALLAAVIGGLLVVAAVVTATVLPAITYVGGRWQVSAILVSLGWIACLAIGFALGRLVPHRWTAPVVALIVYLLNGIPTYLDNGVAQLALVSNLPSGDGQRLRLSVAAVAIVWLVGLTSSAFLAGSARRHHWALVPAVLAVVAATQLAPLPVQWNGNSYSATWTEPDPDAMSRVCSTDEPKVCLNAVHASLLPDVTELVRPILAELPPGSVAAEQGTEHPAERPATAPGEFAIPFLEGRTKLFTADVRDPEGLRAELADSFLRVWCSDQTPAVARAYGIATALVLGRQAAGEGAESHDRVTARLERDPSARRAWLADYLDAGRTCDLSAFAELVS